MSAPDERDGETAPAGPDVQPADVTLRLVGAVRRGERGAFDRLYERVAPALFTWASLRARGGVDPLDVTNEVWWRAWRNLERYDEERSNFRAWIFRIAKNVLLEAFREERRGAGSGAAGPSTRMFVLQNLPDSHTAVSQRVAADDGLQALIEWAAGLEREERELFEHCGLEGMSYSEVGTRMGLQKDTVAKRWQKLRERVLRFAVPVDLVEGA